MRDDLLSTIWLTTHQFLLTALDQRRVRAWLRVGAQCAAGILVAWFLAGCGPGPQLGPRLIVLGLDGVDPEVVNLLVRAGRLPSFALLAQQGASGPLHVEPPLLSPVIWTTIATGKRPREHGIGHFTALDAAGREIPVTSRMRRTAALWNIFSQAEKSVAVVGWWATWPPEAVRGTIVSDHTAYHFLNPQALRPTDDTAAAAAANWVYPQHLAAELAPWIRRPQQLRAQDLQPFAWIPAGELAEAERPAPGRPDLSAAGGAGHDAQQANFAFADDLAHLRWALATAFTYRDLGLQLWQSQRPDLLLVYIEGVDSASHLFGHLFRQHDLAGELAEQQRRFGSTVEKMYELADQIVGQFLAVMDEQTTLVVLSDHGFALGELPRDPSTARDLRRVSERFHRERGILYFYGRGIRAGVRLERATPLDLAPTLLALAGLPLAADMPGRALTAALLEPPSGERIASYGLRPQGESAGSEETAQVDAAMLEKLRSLGYLGNSQNENSQNDSSQSDSSQNEKSERSPKNERNLAFIALQEQRYAEAAQSFSQLLQAQPQDAALLTGLASALGGMGRSDQALQQFQSALAADPLFVPAYHNRGILLEKLGRTDAAIASFRTALRYDPDYEPSARALTRLGASAWGRVPQTPAEQQAARLSQDAAVAMRHGDYVAARELLEQALTRVSDLAAIHQQLANVAYLMGDYPRCRTALNAALALEPDNVLLRHNLERLEQRLSSPSTPPAQPAPPLRGEQIQ